MKVKNLNASSLKTKQLIKETFADLLEQKQDIASISVTELVRKADLNRSTFYSHYDDIWQVAEDLQADNLRRQFANVHLQKLEEMEGFLRQFCTYVSSQYMAYGAMFSAEQGVRFARHLGLLCRHKILQVEPLQKVMEEQPFLKAEISILCDGIAMQCLRSCFGDDGSSLEEIEHVATAWCDAVLTRAGLPVLQSA